MRSDVETFKGLKNDASVRLLSPLRKGNMGQKRILRDLKPVKRGLETQ